MGMPIRRRNEKWDCAVYCVWLEGHSRLQPIYGLAKAPTRIPDDLEARVLPNGICLRPSRSAKPTNQCRAAAEAAATSNQSGARWKGRMGFATMRADAETRNPGCRISSGPNARALGRRAQRP